MPIHVITNLSDFPLKETLDWQPLTVESTITINLSRVSTVSRKANMVLVKAIIQSDEKQLKRIDFGYSDAAVVFVNQKAIYQGHNKFQSRDYRYLGSIGYYDGVFIPLQKGQNELIFAVSENMSDWGLKAKLAE